MRPKAPPITVDIPPLLVSIPRALLDASNGLEGERHHGYKRKLPSEKQNDLSPKRVCPSTSQEGVVKEEGGARGGDRQEAKCKKSVSDITESPRDDDIITEVEMDKETFQKVCCLNNCILTSLVCLDLCAFLSHLFINPSPPPPPPL